MSKSDIFPKTHYLDGYGLYINIGDYDDEVRNRILNRTTKFLKSKKEMKDKILLCFQFDEEDDTDYDDLDYCCQDAVDSGYNYCPNCGSYVANIDNNHHPYNSFEDNRINLHIIDEEEFMKAYIYENDEDDDFFDEIDVYSCMYIEENLFEQVKEDFRKEGLEIL